MEQLQEITENSIQLIIENLLHEKPISITRLTNGITNYVFDVEMPNGDDLIVRASELSFKLNHYLKEQWCINKAREKGVPVPEVLEVGNELIGHPYMVARKVTGIDGNRFEDKIKLYAQMAKFHASINTIETGTYGQVFEWSSNTLSKNETWKDFLDKEIKIPERLNLYKEHNILTKDNYSRLEDGVKALYDLKQNPTLNHGDMRLKNLLVDEEGKIISVLDWENATSAIPYWDLSITIHDLGIDEKDAYLYEYGITPQELKVASEHMKTINVLNYSWIIEYRVQDKEWDKLEVIKSRLNGDFDLYYSSRQSSNKSKGIFSKISNIFK